MSNHDEPAFPSEIRHIASTTFYPGLTKLEYFSGLAMQSLCTNFPITSQSDHDTIAAFSVDIAAAMLGELEKRKL